MSLALWDDWGTWLVAVVAGLAALGWLLRKGLRAIAEVAHGLEVIERMWRLADHELRPNSGASLADKIARTDQAVEDIQARQDAILAALHDMTGWAPAGWDPARIVERTKTTTRRTRVIPDGEDE